MIGRARYQHILTASLVSLIDFFSFFKVKEGYQQAFIFIEDINRASFGSVYKSSKYAMLHSKFTVLLENEMCFH